MGALDGSWARAKVRGVLCDAGWGAAHLEVTLLWRTATAVGVRAEFEYMLDSEEYVWGGRFAEDLRVDVVDARRAECGGVAPLEGAFRGAAAVLAEHGLREVEGALVEVEPGGENKR